MVLNITLTSQEKKDLESYCKLNNLNLEEVAKSAFLQGLKIEMYGLLSGKDGIIEKEVIKEVVKYVEVPKEIEKEVIKIEYVEIEKPIEKIVEKEVVKEVIKEVPVEKVVIQEVIKEVPVDKIVYVTDNQELNEKIFQKDQEFEEERRKFSTKMNEMENIFQNQQNELLLKIQQLENKEPETIEIIKEVPVEKVIEKIVTDDSWKLKLDALQSTVQKLKQDNIDKDKKIQEYEKTIKEIQSFQQEKKAIYLRGSNLDDTLYR